MTAQYCRFLLQALEQELHPVIVYKLPHSLAEMECQCMWSFLIQSQEAQVFQSSLESHEILTVSKLELLSNCKSIVKTLPSGVTARNNIYKIMKTYFLKTLLPELNSKDLAQLGKPGFYIFLP